MFLFEQVCAIVSTKLRRFIKSTLGRTCRLARFEAYFMLGVQTAQYDSTIQPFSLLTAISLRSFQIVFHKSFPDEFWTTLIIKIQFDKVRKFFVSGRVNPMLLRWSPRHKINVLSYHKCCGCCLDHHEKKKSKVRGSWTFKEGKTRPVWNATFPLSNTTDYQDARKERSHQSFRREQDLPVCWAGKGNPELNHFPM